MSVSEEEEDDLVAKISLVSTDDGRNRRPSHLPFHTNLPGDPTYFLLIHLKTFII